MKNRRRFTFLLCFLLLSIPAISQSKKQQALETQRQQKLKEIKQMNALLFSKGKEKKSVLTVIEDLNYKVQLRKNLISITNTQANLLTKEINANQNEISRLRTQLKALKEDYAAMIVKAYKSKSQQSKVMFLLSSENFKQAYKRLQYIKQYTNYQKAQGEIIKTKTADLQALNLNLSAQKKAKNTLIAENKVAKRELETELKARETLMASIKKDINTYANEVKKKTQEAAKLDKEIDRLIKVAIEASNKKTGKKSETGEFILTPESKKLASSFEANKGKLGWPVNRGVIKSKFGKTRSIIDTSIEVNNSGIKIATEENAAVKAVFKGIVSKIVVVKNANPGIMINHGNYFTIYYNLSKVNVKPGDKVSTGQVIGQVFTSKATGASLLDFRIFKNDQKLNPESWLTR